MYLEQTGHIKQFRLKVRYAFEADIIQCCCSNRRCCVILIRFEKIMHKWIPGKSQAYITTYHLSHQVVYADVSTDSVVIQNLHLVHTVSVMLPAEIRL